MYSYRVVPGSVRVIDGDTMELTLDLGFYITHRLTVRLAGLNCPEMNTAEGVAARDFVNAWFAEAKELEVITIRDLRHNTDKTDSLGRRYLAVVMRDSVLSTIDPDSLNDVLLKRGHAQKYPK